VIARYSPRWFKRGPDVEAEPAVGRLGCTDGCTAIRCAGDRDPRPVTAAFSRERGELVIQRHFVSLIGVSRAWGRLPPDHRWFVRTTEDRAMAAGHSVDPAGWRPMFDELMGRIAGRFARVGNLFVP
jgi:hypothetical protein